VQLGVVDLRSRRESDAVERLDQQQPGRHEVRQTLLAGHPGSSSRGTNVLFTTFRV
jgi:hypothetical protein